MSEDVFTVSGGTEEGREGWGDERKEKEEGKGKKIKRIWKGEERGVLNSGLSWLV